MDGKLILYLCCKQSNVLSRFYGSGCKHLKSTGQTFLVWSCQPFWSHSPPFFAMYPVFSSVTPSVKYSRKSSPQSPKLPFVGAVLGHSTFLLSLPVHSISTILPWSGFPIAHLEPTQPPQDPSSQDIPFTSIPHSWDG